MRSFFASFNDRELSLIIWASIFLIGLLFFKKIRDHFPRLVIAFFEPRLSLIYFSVGIYVFFTCYILFKANLWDSFFLKDTVFWFFGVATVLIYQTNKADQPGYFQRFFLRSFRWTILLEFITNFYSFGLIVEILIVPAMFFILVMMEFTKKKKEFSDVNTIFNIFMALLILVIVLHSIIDISKNFKEFATSEHVKEMVLPILLSILFIPANYLLAVHLKYNMIFGILKWAIPEDKAALKKTKLKVWSVCKFSLTKLNKMEHAFRHLDIKDEMKGDKFFN